MPVSIPSAPFNDRLDHRFPSGQRVYPGESSPLSQRRIRPALMTSATTILALIPILTSTGRGSDIMCLWLFLRLAGWLLLY
ncbi:MAG: hypothetical protein QTN59_19760 [Candidatus Electrothrix communis]|nr:MAG: hypothetical protein QTN59_19760 [Candidatus Electrothrix communis]